MPNALHLAADAMAKRFALLMRALERGETPTPADMHAAACALAAYQILADDARRCAAAMEYAHRELAADRAAEKAAGL